MKTFSNWLFLYNMPLRTVGEAILLCTRLLWIATSSRLILQNWFHSCHISTQFSSNNFYWTSLARLAPSRFFDNPKKLHCRTTFFNGFLIVGRFRISAFTATSCLQNRFHCCHISAQFSTNNFNWASLARLAPSRFFDNPKKLHCRTTFFNGFSIVGRFRISAFTATNCLQNRFHSCHVST